MVHLLRTAAGIKDLKELQAVQAHFRLRRHKALGEVVIITTRNSPKRAGELLEGGSVYWIVKNIIQARQPIVDIDTIKDPDGQTCCQILLDPKIIRVSPVAQRAVQGWRYLEKQKAPQDLGILRVSDDSEPPADMARELRAMGLL